MNTAILNLSTLAAYADRAKMVPLIAVAVFLLITVIALIVMIATRR